MSITIIPLSAQIPGSFNGGAIQELRPVIPGNYGLTGYGNLFYWAHAWSNNGGLVDLHPHQGFEIMSYVIEGSIEHYDSLQKKWLTLNAGDLQIIRAGSGVSHAERLHPGSQIFQIWFDPDLSVSIHDAASYSDHQVVDFPVSKIALGSLTTLVGEESPVKMKSKISLKKAELKKGRWVQTLEEGEIMSLFLLGGNIQINGSELQKGDFFRSDTETEVSIEILDSAILFYLICPSFPGYRTYNQRLSMP